MRSQLSQDPTWLQLLASCQSPVDAIRALKRFIQTNSRQSLRQSPAGNSYKVSPIVLISFINDPYHSSCLSPFEQIHPPPRRCNRRRPRNEAEVFWCLFDHSGLFDYGDELSLATACATLHTMPNTCLSMRAHVNAAARCVRMCVCAIALPCCGLWRWYWHDL